MSWLFSRALARYANIFDNGWILRRHTYEALALMDVQPKQAHDCSACTLVNGCLTCQHAKWPDSPATPQTDPEPYNPAPETQKLRDGKAGAVQIDVAELLTAEEDHIPDATKKPSLCKWTYDELEGKWDTECGNAFWFADTIETPSNNGFKYCAYCGGAITSKKEEE